MSGIDKIDTLRQTELFRELDDAALESLAAHAVEKKLAKDELLFIAGERARGLFVIAEGSVRAFRTGADGREQIIHVERAVTTIAEVPVFDDGDHPSTAAAEEPSVVLFIRAADIRSVSIRHPQLALSAAKLLAGRLRKCAELVEALSLREVGQRVAMQFLAEAASRGVETPRGICFDLKITHNQLAARIGTVREVVTRAVTRLQAQGLVVVDGRRVTIPDASALRDYVDQG
ncbi:MAG: Crp/Fnr family transcriptional regulator [Pyrinomonadaceae bacterium]